MSIFALAGGIFVFSCLDFVLGSLLDFVLSTFYPMGVIKQIAEYLYLRKPDPNRPKTNFVRYMHGINRLSILLFLLALLIMLFKLIFRKG